MTLTHGRDAPDWEKSKALFHVWCQRIRDHRLDVCGHWVAELQQARADIEARKFGAVHYHLSLSYDGDAAAGERVMKSLGPWWREITGDEGSVTRWRGRHAFDLRPVGSRGVDRLRISQYLAKVSGIAGLGRELAKQRQKGGSGTLGEADQAALGEMLHGYGRTWGVVNKRLLGQFWSTSFLHVAPGDFVARVVAVRRVLHEVLYPDTVPKVVGEKVAPVKLWAIGDEAQYIASGGFPHLLRLYHIKKGSPAIPAIARIHHQCQRREQGWNVVQTMDGKTVAAVAV